MQNSWKLVWHKNIFQKIGGRHLWDEAVFIIFHPQRTDIRITQISCGERTYNFCFLDSARGSEIPAPPACPDRGTAPLSRRNRRHTLLSPDKPPASSQRKRVMDKFFQDRQESDHQSYCARILLARSVRNRKRFRRRLDREVNFPAFHFGLLTD